MKQFEIENDATTSKSFNPKRKRLLQLMSFRMSNYIFDRLFRLKIASFFAYFSTGFVSTSTSELYLLKEQLTTKNILP